MLPKMDKKTRKVTEVSALVPHLGRVIFLNYTYVGNDSDS